MKNAIEMKTVTPIDTPAKRLLSVVEAANYLSVSVWSIREYIWAGKLPVVRFGRRTLLDKQDLDTWINFNKVRIDA